MAQHDPVELARAAYAAYGETTGGRNYQGQPMPAWEDLAEVIQQAWTVAAATVARTVTAPHRPEN